ncbi:MAG: tetratricopeptide repeat protein [Mariprofundaceae bacterium]|nr:tetratricopeptide repeat protein [Mariprofundaceae bacterium]
MKLPKLLLILTLMLCSAYILSVWLGFDDRLATYAVSHEEDFRASAERGNAEAQYNLAMLYDRGLGVENDDSEALKWYRQAAEQGYAKAQYNLGMMYYFGKGVPQNTVTGYQWIILASDRGEKAAKDAMTALGKKISSEQIANARAAAQTWSKTHSK